MLREPAQTPVLSRPVNAGTDVSLQGPFRPRTGVLTARALDAAALYDPRHERYLTLNPVATRIWEMLEGGMAAPAIAARLSAEFDAPAAQMERDVTGQITDFLRDGLIEPGPGVPDQRVAQPRPLSSPQSRAGGSSAGRAVGVPSVLRCGLTLSRIKWLLHTQRFEGTLAWLRSATQSLPTSEVATLDHVRAIEYSVAMAGAFFPARARCLEQSLTLYYLARCQGIRVRYRQGMQLYPFEAHAWIEYRGEVINDVPEHVKYFTTFPDQLP